MSESSDLRHGRITSIRAQAKSPDRVSLFIDDEFGFGVHQDVLLEFGLAKGVELSIERQQEILARDAYFRARAVAFRYLSYRDRAAAEIRRRLQKAEFAADVVERVIGDLQEEGYVDDHKFAEAYAEGRFRSGGYGPRRVQSDLRRKGVQPAAAEAALTRVFSEQEDTLESARRLGAARWRRLSAETDPLKRKKKVHDYLARRGFGFEMIRRVVEELDPTR